MQRFNLTTIMHSLVILAFIALITFSPSLHFIPYIESHDCQRIIQLLLLALVLLDGIFIGFDKTDKIPVNNKLRLGFFALLALAIASTVHSLEPRYAVIEVTIFAALCYLALFVARLYRKNSEAFIEQLTYALLASILLYMVSFYVGYATAMAMKKTLAWPYPFYGFSNIRLFQQYQLWGLGLICLPLLAFNLSMKAKIWLQVALALWWALLFYAASRGVTLGWIVALIATAIVYKKLAWPFIRIQLISTFSGLGAYWLLIKVIPTWIASTATTAASGAASNAIVTSSIFRDTTYDRLDLWKVAYVMIKNFPSLGVGPMHFYNYNSFGTHPHNSVLQLASEFGVPATLVILAIAGYSFYCWMQKFNAKQLQPTTKLNSNLAIILFFTVTASGAYSLVEGVIVMPISQVLMFTMIGLMIGQYTENTWLVDNTEPIKRKLRFRPIFAAIILIFMILSIRPELERGLTSANRVMAPGERAFSMAPDTINPRIWMQQRRKENTK
jgi:putative inorganic carbon (hco3(-)) transporter